MQYKYLTALTMKIKLMYSTVILKEINLSETTFCWYYLQNKTFWLTDKLVMQLVMIKKKYEIIKWKIEVI